MYALLAVACFRAPETPPPTAPTPPAVAAAARAPAPPSAAIARVDREGRRIIAIGDLHGDLLQSRAALRLAGLIDDEDSWVGGDTILVQTGDTTDRGADSKAIIDLLVALRAPARAAGGEVVLLNGNHEVMNLQGDWRYVAPGDVEAFGGQRARAQAFARDGSYGALLATLPVVAMVDDTVFTHGGLTEPFAELGVDAINALARRHYFDPPGPTGHPIHGPTGPTWYRGYVTDDPASACPALARALGALGARRMVVGHTTQRDGHVASRCDGALAVIDVGISGAYGGNLAVWELTDDDARALTPEGPVDLPDPVASPAAPQ